MKILTAISALFISLFIFPSHLKAEGRALNELIKTRNIKIEATAAKRGLGKNNLALKIINTLKKPLEILIPSGTHFKSEDPGAQDLLIVEETELILAAGTESTIRLTAYCTQKLKYAPAQNDIYVYNGLVEEPLLTASMLLKAPFLEGQRQSIIWKFTDPELPPTNSFYCSDTAQFEIAKNLSRLINGKLGGATEVFIDKGGIYVGEYEKIFSWRGVMSFQVPKPTKASFIAYGPNDEEVQVYFRNRILQPGLKFYTFGINQIIKDTSIVPKYTARLVDQNGDVLYKTDVDANTVLTAKETQKQAINLSFEQKERAQFVFLNIYDSSGQLIQEFRRMKKLEPGLYSINIKAEYFGDPNEKLEVRVEDKNGKIYYKQFSR